MLDHGFKKSFFQEDCTKITRIKLLKLLQSTVITGIIMKLQGWLVGQTGPSFLDLQIITDVNLDKGSAFLTSNAIGYLLGSLVTGYLYDKMEDKVLLVFISTFGIGLATVFIPWASVFELMVFIMSVRGFLGGGLDTSKNFFSYKSINIKEWL